MRKKPIQLLSLFLIFMILLLHNKSAFGRLSSGGANGSEKSRCLERERQALLKLKEGITDDYGILSSWDSKDMDCCNWSGIRCSNSTGRVAVLDLHCEIIIPPHQALRGRINSPSLLELQHLKYLDLAGNDFVGNIPEFIASFSRLQHLNLSLNHFSGPIPHRLGNLSNLQYLDLGHNYILSGYNNDLSGGNLEWLSHLSLLRHLDLSWVNLSKAINWVESISNLPLLENLHLYSCNSPDVIPSVDLSNSSSSIVVVDLSDNHLSNLIYSWLFNLSNSECFIDVSLGYNYLKDSIPNAFGNMISLAKLDLSGNQLEGSIPNSFSNLSHLQSLDLSGNNLSTLLEGSFSDLSHLQSLDLYGNKLSILPEGSFSDLSHLQSLDLPGNKLSTLPEGSFSNLNHLQSLHLYGNRLSTLPEGSFSNLSHLRSLHLYGNKLSTLPEGSFSNLSHLRSLYLYGNKLLTLPEGSFSNLSHLQSLGLSGNKLSTPPEGIKSLSNLQILDASYNSLEGIISESYFSNLKALQELDLSFNKLTLSINSNWVPPFQLDLISLSSCKLGPHFPKWLQHQNNFTSLDISGAKISDKIPSWFWDLSPHLSSLNLSHNQLKYFLPDLSSKFPDIQSIDLSFNCFTGQIPHLPPNITILNLSNNNFSGSMSFLCANTRFQLSFLDLSNNQLSGALPNCWQLFEGLSILKLSNNNLSGKLPSSLSSLYYLVALLLSNNNFSGEFPKMLKKCTELKILDLSENKLMGKIPAWIGTHLTSLIVLTLPFNKFHGSIPFEICHLGYVQILDFSHNHLSGKLPTCFNNFFALIQSEGFEETTPFLFYTWQLNHVIYSGKYEAKTLVQWKGQLREYSTNQILPKTIDLSSNKLSGNIPEQFASLTRLISLNLSKNCLTGKIIKGIGEMKMLEVLDLSTNGLSGEIPTSLTQLNFLSMLNFSRNNFSGKIPVSTQLQSFDPSAFFGNPQLCGLPLPSKCPGEETVVEPPTANLEKDKGTQEDEDGFVTARFYISMGLGFFIGFWAVFGTILFSRHWRGAYFKFLENIIDWFYVTIALKTPTLRRRLL